MRTAAEAVFLVRRLGIPAGRRRLCSGVGAEASRLGCDRRGERHPANLLAGAEVLREGDVRDGEEHEEDGDRADESPVSPPTRVNAAATFHRNTLTY